MALLSMQAPEASNKRCRSVCFIVIFLCLTAFSAPTIAEQRSPDVVIIAAKDKMIYEFHQNGELHMIRVVPNVGAPYDLVPRDPTSGAGDLRGADALVPSWILWGFD